MNNTTGASKREQELTDLLQAVVSEALREHRNRVRLQAEATGGCLIDGLSDVLTGYEGREDCEECEDCEDCEVTV